MTTTVLHLATKQGRKLDRKTSRDHGDPAELETYYSPLQEIEIKCSTQDREDFETSTSRELTAADILGAEEFSALAVYLAANCKLRAS